jgi:hypothetical protein
MKSLKSFLQTHVKEDGSPDTNQDGVLSPSELHQHLDIQKRGVVDMGDYAAHVLFHSHHPEYLAPYIDKFNDVQKRHAAGEKLCENDPVLRKLESKDTLKATNYPVYEGKTVTQHKELDPPSVLVMRRKSVRQFPNGQRVALYYIDKLNKYVTVPYDDLEFASMYEEKIIDKIKDIEQNIVVEHLDGSTTEVTPKLSKSIYKLYNSLNESNKNRLVNMLEESNKHFQTIAKFSKE